MTAGWGWTKLMASVGAKQAIVQGIGFASGILILRRLPAADYALYTLAYSMLGTINVLADGGISSGVMAEAGRVWGDRIRLGRVLATGLALRRQFAIWSLALCVPFLTFLFRQHGASWPTAFALLAAVIVSFWFVLATSVYGVAPALHQRLTEVQRVTILQNLGRLGALAGVLLALPSAIAAIGVTAAAQAWAGLRLKRLSAPLADPHQPQDPAVRAEIQVVVRRMLPSSIYFCLSSQITIWLVGVLGSTTAVAEVGALGRFGQIFAVLSGFSAVVIIPRFARLQNDAALIIRRYFQALLVMGLIGGAIVVLVAIFPREAIWILGAKYRGLTGEVVLQMCGSVLGMLTGIAYTMGSARKCVISPKISIPLEVAWQIAWLFLLDLRTVRGVLCYGIATAGLGVTMHMAYFAIWARRKAGAHP